MELATNKLDELHLYLQAISCQYYFSDKGLLDDLNKFTPVGLVTQKTDVIQLKPNITCYLT